MDPSLLIPLTGFVVSYFHFQKDENMVDEWAKLTKSINTKCRGVRYGQ